MKKKKKGMHWSYVDVKTIGIGLHHGGNVNETSASFQKQPQAYKYLHYPNLRDIAGELTDMEKPRWMLDSNVEANDQILQQMIHWNVHPLKCCHLECDFHYHCWCHFAEDTEMRHLPREVTHFDDWTEEPSLHAHPWSPMSCSDCVRMDVYSQMHLVSAD